MQGFVLPAPHLGHQHSAKSNNADQQQHSTDRALDEHHRAATGNHQGPAEIFFQHRPQHEANQQGRRFAAQLDEQVTDKAEKHGLVDIECGVVHRIDPDGAEHEDRREQKAIGHAQQRHPEADQRQVDDQQHEVADPHRCDQAPEQLRLGLNHPWPGLDSLDHQSTSQALTLWNALYDDDPKAAFWQGVYSTVSYDLDTALTSFKRAIELDPNDPKARQELAEVHLEKANFEQSRELFQWLVEHGSDSPEIITGYARSLLNLGFADQASEQLKKLPDVTKLPSPELALVCETNLEADQAQQASDQASILLKRWPYALPYLQLKARSLAKLGQTAESEKLFAQAAESQNRRPQVDQMIERMATEINNQQLRRDMGELMMNYLDPAGGVGYVQIASRADPFDLKTQEILASYYEKEGNLQIAENHRRMIRRIQQVLLDSIDATTPPSTNQPTTNLPTLPPALPTNP